MLDSGWLNWKYIPQTVWRRHEITDRVAVCRLPFRLATRTANGRHGATGWTVEQIEWDLSCRLSCNARSRGTKT